MKLRAMDRDGIRIAQDVVTTHHYLRRPVDSRCSVEGYWVDLDSFVAGLFLLGRPEATRCGEWYGGVEDVQAGRCEVTRWQVLNLARVWVHPNFQAGNLLYGYAPGFRDRHGRWRSTLASSAITALAQRVGVEYLLRRPPCFLDEPYELRWLMSYCDTRLHKGTIYRAAGFELFRTNREGIQTWRLRLPGLTAEEDGRVREAARVSVRSQAYRARRAQLRLEL